MQYTHWKTMTDEVVASNKQFRKLSVGELQQQVERGCRALEKRNARLACDRLLLLYSEAFWEQDGRPYYNVRPEIIPHLLRVNLDKVPCSLIELPHKLTCVSFRFSTESPLVCKPEGEHGLEIQVLSALVTVQDGADLMATYKRHFPDSTPEKSLHAVKEDLEAGNQLFFVYTKERYRNSPEEPFVTRTGQYPLLAASVDTVPTAMSRLLNQTAVQFNSGTVTTKLPLAVLAHVHAKLFQLIITCGFLANAADDADGIVQPEILNADKLKYEEARQAKDTDTMARLQERAKRKGLTGYNIGTKELFVNEDVPVKGSSKATGQRELSHSHLRQGHFHTVRYGPGGSKVMLKWFRPVRVRPDLPFKSD